MIRGILFWLILIIISLTVYSCEKENDQGQRIYFNSFEFKSDTAGWRGYAFKFADDAPFPGGKKSLAISGACTLPQAEYIIKPQRNDSYLVLRLWGKRLIDGGYVYLNVNNKGSRSIEISVSENKWTRYESKDTLFCPANTSMTLGAAAGGITIGSILVDMVEIVRLNVSP